VSGDEVGVVDRYLEVGLRLGRHNPEIVDAYYGPGAISAGVASEPVRAPEALRGDVRRLLADLDGGIEPGIAGRRRAWIAGQLRGLEVVCAKLAGDDISYVDEVEACYGVTPRRVDESEIADAQVTLDDSLPGSGPVADRLAAFRDAHVIPPDRVDGVIADLLDEFRVRTDTMFGLPDGERVRFEIVSDKPWSGFNYYEGDLSSRVAINSDLPVLSTSVGHLVAHEAYPGHHTEHCLKEVGLVRRHHRDEESLFLVGTPQCLMAEGLADLGLEVLLGEDRLRVVGDIVRSHGVTHDDEVIASVTSWGEMSSRVRGNLGMMLHADGTAPDDVMAYAERWLLVDRPRAAKSVEFMCDPTWRAYISCYVEGLPLCRDFVDGDPGRFARLLTEQLLPSDLIAA